MGSKLGSDGYGSDGYVVETRSAAGEHFAGGFDEGCPQLSVSNRMVMRLCVLFVANVR